MAEDEHPGAGKEPIVSVPRQEAAIVCPKHGSPLVVAPGLWTLTTIGRSEIGLARSMFCRACHVEESAGVARPMPRKDVDELLKP